MDVHERSDEALQRGETGELQRVDLTTRDRVTAIQAKWEGSLRRMWFAILGLYVIAAAGGYLLWANNRDIQTSRLEAAYQSCQESNDRHDRTVAAFNVESRRALRLAETARERRQLRLSRAANIRLINVFIPVHKDAAGFSTCRAFARERINPDGNH